MTEDTEGMQITEEDFKKMKQKDQMVILFKNTKIMKETSKNAKNYALRALLISGGAMALTSILLVVVLNS